VPALVQEERGRWRAALSFRHRQVSASCSSLQLAVYRLNVDKIEVRSAGTWRGPAYSPCRSLDEHTNPGDSLSMQETDPRERDANINASTHLHARAMSQRHFPAVCGAFVAARTRPYPRFPAWFQDGKEGSTVRVRQRAYL
jgi:hypothetical protein